MKKNHAKTYIIVAILISIVGISIAYAALSQQLQIKTNASIQSSQTSWNFVITENYCYGLQYDDTQRNVEGYKVDIKGTTVTISNVIIRAPGDTFGCNFSIENKGEVDAKVQSKSPPKTTFSGTGSNATADANLVKTGLWTYSQWNNPRTEINIGDILSAGEKKEIEIGFGFNVNMTTFPTNSVTFSITFSINFEQA